MCARVALVYNKPEADRYGAVGEESAEFGVLEAVAAVEKSLHELQHEVTLVPLVPPPSTIRSIIASLSVDLIFNLFEGFSGSPETEALLPDIADELKIPYTGCPGRVLRLALDKASAKAILKANGIRTPDFQVLNPQNINEFHLKYPCIVKPRAEDASHGISDKSVVNDFESLKRQVEAMTSTYGADALVEEFIDGREFNASGMGNKKCIVLPPSEMVYHLPEGLPRVLTFDAKWKEDSPYFSGTSAVCPADITPAQKSVIAKVVLRVYRLFGCRCYTRVDMRMDFEGKIHVIEVNPNPDISPGTGAARQSAAAGMSYTEFVRRIIKLAVEPQEDVIDNIQGIREADNNSEI